MVTGSARSRLIAFAVMAVTFLAGGMAGFAMHNLLAAEEAQPAEAQPRPDRNERRDRRWIFDDLNLTAEQRAQVDSIFAQNRREMDAFWDEHGPTMKAIVDSTRAAVDRVLTPEQRAQMQEFRERRRKEMQERGNRERNDGPPGAFGPRHLPGDSLGGKPQRGGGEPAAPSPDAAEQQPTRGRASPAPSPRERPMPTTDLEPRPALALDRNPTRHVDLKYS